MGAGKKLAFIIICTFFSSVSVSAQRDWILFWFATLCRVELQAFQCGLTPLPAPLHLTELQQKTGLESWIRLRRPRGRGRDDGCI